MPKTLSETVVLKDGTLAKQKVVKLKSGDAGVVEQTIPVMIRLAKRDAKDSFVKAIVRDLKAKTDIETIRNIFNWMVDNYKYVSDPVDSEYVTAPIYVVKNIAPESYFDCDDMSAVLAMLLISAGYKVAYKTIAWRKHDYTHVYVVVYVPSLNGWIPLDPVMKRKGFGAERAPVIRTQIFPINSQTAESLNDDDVEIDIDEWSKQSLLRLIRGESDVATEAKLMVAEVCQQGVKQRMKQNAVPIAIGTTVTLLTAGAIGYQIGKSKKR